MPHRIEQQDLHLAASIGVVTYPDDGTDAETLLKHADLAMYRAKDSGRNTYRFFEPDMNGYTADAAIPRKRTASRDRAPRIRVALPADNAPGFRGTHRRRGTPPLASPAARARPSGTIRAD